MLIRVSFLLLLFALTSCGNIQPSSSISTDGVEINGILTAGVGDAIIEVIEEESMPNAFGRADIFGRTRPTGTVGVYYAGLSGANAIFLRRDVEIMSAQTTMNSSPMMINRSSTTSFSGNLGGYGYSGSSITSASPIFLPPNTPNEEITDIRDIEIKIPLSNINKPFVVSGKSISIISADENQIKYTLEE